MVRRVKALVAVVALLPIVLAAGCGSGKPKPKAAVASTPATSTPTSTSTSTTTHSRTVKHHSKVAAHHAHARHPAAAKQTHHGTTATSAKPRSSATQTTAAPTATSTPQASSSITLDLIGRSGDTHSRVCGAPRHYRTYLAGQAIGVSGHVNPIPSATWKVKIKIKICSGAVFTDYVKFDATLDKHHGTFTGSFPAPAAGFYEARAELYVNDVQTVISADEHFKTH